MAVSLAQRLESHSVQVGDCIEWTGYINKLGYGKMYVNYKAVNAHRISWTIACGQVPDGMMVLHSCDNRRCVNVKHLRLGTQKDNMADVKARKRRLGVGGQRGSKHHQAKLNEEQVVAIRASKETDREIAEKHGLTKRYVWAIRHRITWKHI